MIDPWTPVLMVPGVRALGEERAVSSDTEDVPMAGSAAEDVKKGYHIAHGTLRTAILTMVLEYTIQDLRGPETRKEERTGEEIFLVTVLILFWLSMDRMED